MSPKKLPTHPGDKASAKARLHVADKYLEVARLMTTDGDPYAINVCVGTAVLAGIAAADAICLEATGERYSGQDHAAAAELLERVEAQMGKHLKRLVALKPGAHYGDKLLTLRDRQAALRAADRLAEDARGRLR